MQAVIYEGAKVILPGEVAQVSVRIEAGQITGIDTKREIGRAHV